MPIYEYACARCARKMEVIQGMNDPPPRVCPHCGGKLKKVASAPAIQFKGSGFYITDYADKGGDEGKKRAEGEKAEKADKSEKAEGDKGETPGKSEAAEKSAKTEKTAKTSKKKDKKTAD